ncbi:hypothetical protein [Bartonella taylorii]|uniref:hypothetical protein n=1 Tax=Bartonella taylorii TaxID=33046 RepID=UPI001ABA273D|nr:hypothetical protein [Bartonella taylorii]
MAGIFAALIASYLTDSSFAQVIIFRTISSANNTAKIYALNAVIAHKSAHQHGL